MNYDPTIYPVNIGNSGYSNILDYSIFVASGGPVLSVVIVNGGPATITDVRVMLRFSSLPNCPFVPYLGGTDWTASPSSGTTRSGNVFFVTNGAPTIAPNSASLFIFRHFNANVVRVQAITDDTVGGANLSVFAYS